jgi:integrase
MLGMVATAPDKLAGLRDRALLLLGFAGAFRRSELVALDVSDIEETEAGLRVTIRHSKTDQEGQGITIAIARGDVACPIKALREWLSAGGIEAGPLFRPINKAGRGGSSATDGSFSCKHREGSCRTCRVRCQHFFRPLAAIRVSHICGGKRRVDIQDDGCVPAQVGGDLARLCA